MSYMSAAMIGGQLLSSYLQYQGATDAARLQSDAARQAAGTQLQMYNTTRSDLAPYRDVGPVALSRLQYLTGLSGTPEDQQQAYAQSNDPNFGILTRPFSMQDFQQSPAYQFNLEQGQKAIDKASAAREAFYNPATLQDISRFSQGLASNEFQNAFSNYQTNNNNLWNRIYGLVGTGQSAANQTGAFGAAAGQGIAQSTLAGGEAAAAGKIGQANALSGGINSAYNAYLTQQILNRNQRSVYDTSGETGGYLGGGGDYGYGSYG